MCRKRMDGEEKVRIFEWRHLENVTTIKVFRRTKR